MSKILSLRFKQFAIALLAGVVLLLNTACSGSAEAKMPSVADNDPHPVNQTQPYKGGMNNFDDTPPEQIPANKAKSLVDNAQRNIDAKEPRNAKLYKDPGYAADRAGETLGGTLKTRVNNAKEKVEGIVDRGTSNLKDNVTDAAEDTAFKAKQAAETVKTRTQNAVDATKDAID
jgi:uncharacterized protein YjbJ (UPF0337 family)